MINQTTMRALAILLCATAPMFPAEIFAESTATVGGAGGAYFTRQCPPGQYLIGVNGRTGLYVDAIEPVCATVAGTSWRTPNPISHFGDDGSLPIPAPVGSGEQRTCATDRLLNAVTVAKNTTGAFVSSLQAHCRQISGNRTSAGPALTGSAPRLNEQRLECPNGQFGKGFSGRSGEFVDSIRLDCAPLSGEYGEDTLMEAGGSGGAPAESVCPGNMRMMGVISSVERGVFGTWIKGLRPMCSTMPSWQQNMLAALLISGQVGDLMRLAPGVGLMDGDSNRLICPAGQYVQAVETHYDRFVHSVRLRCRSMDYSSESPTALSGRNEGKRELLACPGDMVAAGIVVRAGSAVDALRLRCKRDANPGTKLLAIVGDSFSAGEGAPDIVVSGGLPPQDEGPNARKFRAGWVDRPCHRSNKAGVVLAAKRLVRETNGQVVFRNFSCSGATVGEGLEFSQPKTSENSAVIDPQLQTAAEWSRSRNSRIHTLLVSIGGNDAGFGAKIGDCAVAELFEDLTLGLMPGACGDDQDYLNGIREEVSELPNKFANLNNALANGLQPAHVFLRTYPDPVRNANGFCDNIPDLGTRPGGWPLVDGFLERTLHSALEGFTGQSSQLVFNEFIVPMNRAITDEARTYNWRVVDGWAVETRGHGFCAIEGERYFNTPSDTHRDQGSFNGVFHPNAAGYESEAPLIVNALLPVLRAVPAGPAVRPPAQPPAAAPPRLNNQALQRAVDNYLIAQNKRSKVKQRALWDVRARPNFATLRTGYQVETDVLVGSSRARIRFTLDSRGKVTGAAKVQTASAPPVKTSPAKTRK